VPFKVLTLIDRGTVSPPLPQLLPLSGCIIGSLCTQGPGIPSSKLGPLLLSLFLILHTPRPEFVEIVVEQWLVKGVYRILMPRPCLKMGRICIRKVAASFFGPPPVIFKEIG
jgi:hypothetical protein